MNNNIIKLLLFICGVLLVILLIEWLVTGSIEDQLSEPLLASKVQQNQNMELSELTVEKQTVETYSDMVERPLFIEGRKPVFDSEEASVEQKVINSDDLALMGVFSVDGSMVALFGKQGSDEKYSKKSKGDDISGWLLKEIQVDRVVLERLGQQQTLMLRKPKPKTIIKPKAVLRKRLNLNAKKKNE